MLIDLVSVSDTFNLPVIGHVRPWQAVFLIIGVPGILLSLLSFTMPEPVRRGVRQEQKSVPLLNSMFSSYPALLKFMASQKRFFFYHYAGFGLASIGFVGASAWYPAYLGREFGWTGSQIGL